MLHQVFSVYDSKAQIYSSPWLAMNKSVAIRQFTDSVNDSSLVFNKHPEDYALFHLGDFDDVSGVMISLPSPLSLGLAQEYLNR